MNLIHSPIDILVACLTNMTLGNSHDRTLNDEWPVFQSFLPSGKGADADVLGVMEVPGFVDGRLMKSGETIYHPGLRIVARGRNHDVTRTKLITIGVAMETLHNYLVNLGGVSYSILTMTQTTSVMYAGIEDTETRLHQFAADFLMSVKKEEVA